ncbi:MAG: dTMP kinase [Deltaproteobacteria bacterium CG2_30_66_27]|nr:MAG: dTMP kinase [Deltaproteobacteria bacterium CG2_30_66_27]
MPLLRLQRVLTKGPFVTFEGIEGSGKTTQIRRLSAHLAAEGVLHLVTREPGGTPLSDEIRALVLVPREETVFPEAELLLYEAARAQHVRGVILPALLSGKAVLCDRFCDATTVYQAGARGLDAALVERLNRFTSGGLAPDLTLLFDLPPEEGFARVKGRGGTRDRLERESLDFHRAVREEYLRLAGRDPGRVLRIDADAPEEEVFRSVLRTVAQRFGW